MTLIPTADAAEMPSSTRAPAHQTWLVPSPARPWMGIVERIVRTASTNHTPQMSRCSPTNEKSAAYCMSVAARHRMVLATSIPTCRGRLSSASASSAALAHWPIHGSRAKIRVTCGRTALCAQRPRKTAATPPTAALAMTGASGSSVADSAAATTTMAARLIMSRNRARMETLAPRRRPTPNRRRASRMKVASADGPGRRSPAPHEIPTAPRSGAKGTRPSRRARSRHARPTRKRPHPTRARMTGVTLT